jgi:cyclin A
MELQTSSRCTDVKKTKAAPQPPKDRLAARLFPTLPIEEVVQVMRETEARKKLEPLRDVDLIRCRHILVEWLIQLGDALSLETLTVHSAVYTLNRLLSKQTYPKSKLQLLGCCCLLIQAKMNEQEESVPTITELNYSTDNTYTTEDFIQMETTILSQMSWVINEVTPAHFLGLLLSCCVSDKDTIHGISLQNFNLVKTDVTKSSTFFVDMCRLEQASLEFLPSVIAASALFLSRRILKLTPTWSDSLIELSRYRSDDLNDCVDYIWRIYLQNFLTNTAGT